MRWIAIVALNYLGWWLLFNWYYLTGSVLSVDVWWGLAFTLGIPLVPLGYALGGFAFIFAICVNPLVQATGFEWLFRRYVDRPKDSRRR